MNNDDLIRKLRELAEELTRQQLAAQFPEPSKPESRMNLASWPWAGEGALGGNGRVVGSQDDGYIAQGNAGPEARLQYLSKLRSATVRVALAHRKARRPTAEPDWNNVNDAKFFIYWSSRLGFRIGSAWETKLHDSWRYFCSEDA